jgi:hypothetical protein
LRASPGGTIVSGPRPETFEAGHGRSSHVEGCQCTRCRGFEVGNEVRLAHGAYAERRIRPQARAHRRRVLRRLRLSPRDLDPFGKGYLDAYCRLLAKIEAIDAYIEEHGLVRDDGEPQPVMRLYVALQNSARLALARLEDHLQRRLDDPLAVLEGIGRQVIANHGDGRPTG